MSETETCLVHSLRHLAHVSSDSVRELARRSQRIALEPGEFLLRAGETPTQVAWVMGGLVREYFLLPDGSERTKAFIARNQVTGSLADLLAGTSRAFIVAEEATELAAVELTTLRELARKYPDVDEYNRRAIERVALIKAEREYELLALDAEGRYEAFLARYPGLETRVPARHVASYVGITPVHLSRLRRRRRNAR